MAFCTECGADIPEGMRFCTGCGKQVGDPQAAQAPAPVAMPVQTPAASIPVQTQPSPAVAHQAPPRPVVPSARQGRVDIAPPKGSKYAVMGTGAYFGTILLFCVPVIGWVACIIMAFAGGKQNRKNFARAMLIFIIIGILLSVALYFVSSWVFEVLMDYAAETARSGLSGLSG